MLCGLLCYVAVLANGTVCRAVPCHLLPLRGTSNFHFLPIHPVFGSSSRWRSGKDVYLHFFFSSLCWLSKAPCGPAFMLVSCRPSSSAPPPPPCSRGGRPVSAKPIGKQRLKMYLPVSFSSSTSKHSNRSRKSVVGPQFLLTMICCHLSAASSTAKI